MLAPHSRAVLLEQLRPPSGCMFDEAVATTFTLDLSATLIPALAFSSFSYSGSTPDPVAVLESLRRATGRFDVYCQAGSIAVPQQAADLMAFLEPVVHEVRRPRGGLFHPKVWFVRYADDDGDPSYRLLVLTRNLGNGNSWDIAVRLDSEHVSGRPQAYNRPLAEFLRGLPSRAVRDLSPERAERASRLAKESRHIIWSLPETVEEMQFHYLDSDRPSTVDVEGRRHLAVSPFVNDAGVGLLAGGESITVVSRAEELDRLDPATLEGLDTRVIDAMAGIDESDHPTGEDAKPHGLLGQLHAKMFVIEPWGRAQKAHVLIGSANATDAAFTRNVEFLVELRGPRKHLGIDAFLGPNAEFATLLAEYEPVGGVEEDPKAEEERRLENALRAVAEIPHRVLVEPSESAPDGATSRVLTVTTPKPYPIPEDWDATVELLTRPGEAGHVSAGRPLEETFTISDIADITPFLAVRLTTSNGLGMGTVVVAELIGDVADRLDLVLARQIDTPEKFLRFVYLILSLGDPYLLAQLAQGAGAGAGVGTAFGDGPGVLEMVLRALADRPSALDDLDRLVQRLQATERGREVLPEGFEQLWQVVREAHQQDLGRTP